MKHPYRVKLTFTAAETRTEDVNTSVLLGVAEALGWNFEGGFVERMEDDEVIEGSPLHLHLDRDLYPQEQPS